MSSKEGLLVSFLDERCFVSYVMFGLMYCRGIIVSQLLFGGHIFLFTLQSIIIVVSLSGHFLWTLSLDAFGFV